MDRKVSEDRLDNKVECKVCSIVLKNYIALAKHLKHQHNLSSEAYYRKYIMKPGEDICENPSCNNKTKWLGVSRGYYKFCCRKCYHIEHGRGMTGDKNLTFKDGKQCKDRKYYCSVCYTEVNWNNKSGKCRSCYQKGRFEDPKNHPMFGRKRPDVVERNNKTDYSREHSPAWKGGITALHILIAHLDIYKIWRQRVFNRDNYTCQRCGKLNCYLEAHHIKPFSKIFQDFLNEYNQFSPIDNKDILVKLAMSWQPFWEVANGETLCMKCHRGDNAKRKTCQKKKEL